MAFLNRCIWRAASAGAGPFTVASAITGYYEPGDCANPAVVDGATYRYIAESDDLSEHEEGFGTYDVGDEELTPTIITSSSNAGSAVTFTAAPKIAMGGSMEQDAAIWGGNNIPDVIIQDQKSSTEGGSVAGGVNVRTLNTVVRNHGSIASLSSNQITLPAGTYLFKWSCPAYNVQNHQSELYDVTNAAILAYGQGMWVNGLQSSSIGMAVVTVSGSTAFEIRHDFFQGVATIGGGIGGPGSNNIYTSVQIWKQY